MGAALNKNNSSYLNNLIWLRPPSLDLVTYMESKPSREVVHATGVHQTQRVLHRLLTQHTLTCDWADATICQGGCHDTGALASHLNGAQLEVETEEQFYDLSVTTCFI